MEGGKSERHKTTVTEEESVLHRCTGEDSCINAGKTLIKCKKALHISHNSNFPHDAGSSREQRKHML